MMLKDWENLRVIDPWYVRFGMNPLQLMPYSSAEEKSIQIQNQISQLILILEDILKTDSTRATRMTWIFRGSLHYLYHFSDDVTFLDLYNLMHDMMVMDRDELKEMLRDADIEDDVINKTLEAIITLKEEAFTPVMNRIFNFVVHEGSMASRVFCARQTTLDWDWMLEPGHVTVIRMEAFNIPEDFRNLFTNSLVLKLYFLIQHRAKELERQGRDPADRTPVYLMIDEFQSIEKLEALERILSESAKYGLLLGLAHQNMAQLSRKELLQSILANVGLIVSFKVNSDDASALAKVFGEEWKAVLCEKLRRFEVVTRRTLDDGSAEVVRTTTSLAPPLLHTAEELKEFMRTKMNELHGGAREDRKPIYKDEKELVLKEKHKPWLWVARYVPAVHLFLVEGKGKEEEYLSTLSLMETTLYGRCGWAKSVVENSLDELEDLHYVSKSATAGYVADGRDAQGNFVWRRAREGNFDELARARTYLYSLTDLGREKLFPKVVPKSQRAGGMLHRTIMEKLIAEYRDKGYWVDADWGDRHGKRPDLVVFRPGISSFFDDTTKTAREIWNTNVWDYARTLAIEIETNPWKNKAQVRLNYAKCIRAGYDKVHFKVADKRHDDDLKRILSDKDDDTFDVEVVTTGLSFEEVKKMVEEEAKIPAEGWVQLAPGDGVEIPEAGRTQDPIPAGAARPEDVMGPLGEMQKDAYERVVREIWPYYLEHGKPKIDRAYLRNMATNPGWMDDPIWKSAEEKEAARRLVEERIERNVQPTHQREEKGPVPPQRQPLEKLGSQEPSNKAETTPENPTPASSGNEAGVRRLPPLKVVIADIVGGLEDEAHGLEDGRYRISFAEIWERLKERYGGANDSGNFVGPDGKVIIAAIVGKTIREGLSGEPAVWWEGGKAVRGYLWKEKVGAVSSSTL